MSEHTEQMLDGLESLQGLEALDAATIKKAIQDLRQGGRFAMSAARYLFFDGEGIDESDPNTFQALCLCNNIDQIAPPKQSGKSYQKKRKTDLCVFSRKRSAH